MSDTKEPNEQVPADEPEHEEAAEQEKAPEAEKAAHAVKRPHARPAVEPDRPPVGAMAIWIIALLFIVGLIIVVVIQFFYVSTAQELESKAQTDRSELLAARERDRQRLTGIEDAMARVAANPDLLGVVPAPGDGEQAVEDSGDTAQTDQPEQPTPPQDVAPEGTGEAVVPEGTGEAVAPEGTGEAVAPEGTGEAVVPEGTGEQAPSREGTGSAP